MRKPKPAEEPTPVKSEEVVNDDILANLKIAKKCVMKGCKNDTRCGSTICPSCLEKLKKEADAIHAVKVHNDEVMKLTEKAQEGGN